jgi:hypothetical protein
MSKKYKYRVLTQNEIKELVTKILKDLPDWDKSYEFTEYEDNLLHIPLGECIKDAGDYSEKVDSSYVHCDYTSEILGNTYHVRGSSYRKDQSICDEELGEEISILEEIILSKNEIRNNILKKIESHKSSILKLEKQLNE